MEFTCVRCGRCCRNLVPIVVLSDVERWLEVGAARVLENVVRVKAKGFVRRFGVEYCFALRRRGGACVFYEGGLCSIYDIRPSVCRLFPFAPSSSGLAVHPWAERNCLGVRLSAKLPPREAEELEALAERVTRELLLLPQYSALVEEVLERYSSGKPRLSGVRVRVDAV
jgi:Fe-S-cluster containining protein